MIEEHSSPVERSISDGKFHIQSTGSSIDVLSGDITDIPVRQTSSFSRREKPNIVVEVDLMICISTSNNLRDSVLRRAGRKIADLYQESSRSNDALLLDGGSTSARKILFVPWETDIDTKETIENKKVIPKEKRYRGGGNVRFVV